MNMKKTIAAVSACAIAVSAMATTVSAVELDESVSVSYRLTHTHKTTEKASITLKASVEAKKVVADTDEPFILSISAPYCDFAKKPIKITGRNGDNNKNFAFTLESDPAAAYYDGYAEWNSAWEVYNVYIPVTSSYYRAFTKDESGEPAENVQFVAEITGSKGTDDYNEVTKQAELNAQILNDRDITNPQDITSAQILGSLKSKIITIGTNGEKINYGYYADKKIQTIVGGIFSPTSSIGNFPNADYAYSVWGVSDDDEGEKAWSGLGISDEELTAEDSDKTVNMTVSTNLEGAGQVIRLVTTGQYTGGGTKTKVYPMTTGMNNSYWHKTGNTDPNETEYTIGWTDTVQFQNDDKTKVYGSTTTDVINWLETMATYTDLYGTERQGYNNVKAVINDILANYEDVTFTFKTAAQPVKIDIGTVTGAAGYYDAEGIKTYTKFTQNSFNLFGAENSGYIYTSGFDWTNSNLFQGALVVNGVYTMQLSDINTFDYGMDTITFSWDDITKGSNINAYVNVLTEMRFATSDLWFWDELTIKGAKGAAEDVGTGEGIEADEGDLDEMDEDEDTDIIDDEDEEDVDFEDEDEDEDEEPADEEEAPAPAPAPVENPKTGNAPIALAVIPAALAAAAIVAKKRG